MVKRDILLDIKKKEVGLDKLRKLAHQPVLFIGSGLSLRYLGTPTWNELLEKVCEKIGIDKRDFHISRLDNLEKSQYLEALYYSNLSIKEILEKGRKFPFRNLIKDILVEIIKSKEAEEKAKKYQDELDALKSVNCRAIITTNYDTFLEDKFDIDDTDVYKNKDKIFDTEQDIITKRLFKIHGSIKNPESMIITKEDYDDFFEKSKYIYSKLLTFFVESPLIFLGYSISDKNIKDILTTIVSTLSPEEKEKFQNEVYIVEYAGENPECFIENQDLELLNGKTLEVNVLYLDEGYKELYEVLSEVSLSEEKLCFDVDKDNVINHFIMPLYVDQETPKVVMRELLQNAMDACKMKGVEYDIKINLNKGEDSLFLEIEDNGIGMSLQDIKGSYLKIASSSKTNPETNIVGHFGIGALSMFLLSDYIEIYTKKSEAPIRHFIMQNSENTKKEVELVKNNLEKFCDSFTKIRLRLDEETSQKIYAKLAHCNSYEEANTNRMINIFGLKQWFIEKGKINFSYSIDNQEGNYEISKLDLNEFKPINCDKTLYMLKSENKNNYPNMNSYIVFNDMISKLDLENVTSQFFLKKLPLLYFRGKMNDLIIPLDRSKVIPNKDLMDSIKKEYYRLRINELFTQVEDIDKVITISPERFLDSVPVVIKNKKLQFSDEPQNCLAIYFIDNKNKTNFFEQYDSNELMLYSYEIWQSRISNAIKENTMIALSKAYIDQYLFSQSYQMNGFQWEAIKKLLDVINCTLNDYKSKRNAAEMREFVKVNKERLKKEFDKEYVKGMLWIIKDYQRELNISDKTAIMKQCIGAADPLIIKVIEEELKNKPRWKEKINIISKTDINSG